MHHVSPLICLELIQLCLFLYHYTSTPMLFLEFLFYSLRSALDLRMKLLTLRKKFTILINSRMQEQYQLSTALGQYLASIGQSELSTVPLKGKYHKKNDSEVPSMDSFTKIYIDLKKL